MKETIISGKANPGIDPIISVWNWEIPLYLFLGGLAAGLLFFAALFTILKKEDKYKVAVGKAAIFAPIAIIIGLVALFLDLKHKLYFWQLYTTLEITSPMSWGAWVLLLITPLSFLWVGIHIKEFFPNWEWKWKLLVNIDKWGKNNKLFLAWVMIILAVILGVYTGILLSAFSARALWNTTILGPLFLTSGLSSGAALIMWMSKDKTEVHSMGRIDLLLIGLEVVLIGYMFMGLFTNSEIKIKAAEMFFGGEYTYSFWGLVVGVGLILPALIEILKLKGVKIHAGIPAFFILAGGLAFRMIMVSAGQML